MATAVRPQVDSASSQTEPISNAVAYRCGEPVPAPGTYWVWHRGHRMAHEAKVRFTTFPPCAKCGQAVRYLPSKAEKAHPTEWLRRDPDFRNVLAVKKRFKAPAAQSQIGTASVVGPV